jgi:hypothetical protein
LLHAYSDDFIHPEPLLFSELPDYEAGDVDGVSRHNANWGDDDQPYAHSQRPRGFSDGHDSVLDGVSMDDVDDVDDDAAAAAAALAAFADSLQLPHDDPDLPGMYRDWTAGRLVRQLVVRLVVQLAGWLAALKDAGRHQSAVAVSYASPGCKVVAWRSLQ